jgi:pantothenate kinase
MASLRERTPSPMSEYDRHISRYARELADVLAEREGRVFLGVTGGPAAGKSTFTHDLVAAVNTFNGEEVATVVPMDGFHRYNVDLQAAGLWGVKGVPETFRAQEFIDLLIALRDKAHEEVRGPIFDRTTDEPVEEGLTVLPHHRLVVVEGNYLNLDTPPWDQAHDYFWETWYLETPEEEIVPRLRERHKKRGLKEGEEIDKKIASDLENGKLIEASRPRAHRVLHVPQDKA